MDGICIHLTGVMPVTVGHARMAIRDSIIDGKISRKQFLHQVIIVTKRLIDSYRQKAELAEEKLRQLESELEGI
jgi:hypothetical protein